jgi:hypothetical protein
MAIADFQRALADLIASPQKCIAARNTGRSAFSEYALSEREISRLQTMVMDEGMSINCTLYRVNRLTPVYSVLPMTCQMLGDAATRELESFWEASRDATLQYRWEAWRFGTWLLDRIAASAIPGGPIEDVIHFELACFDVRTTPHADFAPDAWPHPRKRLLQFHHDPSSWLTTRSDSSARGVLLDATGPDLEMTLLGEEEVKTALRS